MLICSLSPLSNLFGFLLYSLTFVPTPSSIWLFLLLYRAFPTSLSNFSLSCTGLFPLLYLTLPFLYRAFPTSLFDFTLPVPGFTPVSTRFFSCPVPGRDLSNTLSGFLLFCTWLNLSTTLSGFLLFCTWLSSLSYPAFSCPVPGFSPTLSGFFLSCTRISPLPYLDFASSVPGFLPYPIWVLLLLYPDFSPTLFGFCFSCTWSVLSPPVYLAFSHS